MQYLLLSSNADCFYLTLFYLCICSRRNIINKVNDLMKLLVLLMKCYIVRYITPSHRVYN